MNRALCVLARGDAAVLCASGAGRPRPSVLQQRLTHVYRWYTWTHRQGQNKP